ncbi:MAG: hypothetical protein LBQ77_08785 [Treponema sp.]|nr:hypothetical protein [Treponema sp.]
MQKSARDRPLNYRFLTNGDRPLNQIPDQWEQTSELRFLRMGRPLTSTDSGNRDRPLTSTDFYEWGQTSRGTEP